MTAAIVAFWLGAAGFVLPAQAPPSDLHLVVESQFVYLASVRPTTMEVWWSPGKRMTKLRDRVTIRREDLGVRWTIDLKAGTYTEAKIEPPAPPPPPAKEDIHTVGQGYFEPEFEWTVGASGQKTALHGRPCTHYAAVGDSDYAEGTVNFWLCEPIARVPYPVNDSILVQMRSASAQKMVEQAAKERNMWVLGIEEMQEPPIAPTMTISVSVKALEAIAAPPGTFELPANVKKAGR